MSFLKRNTYRFHLISLLCIVITFSAEPRFFLDGTDPNSEGVWKYHDGNVLHYQNFYEGGRNGGFVGNCIVIVKRVEYKWFDVKCHPLIPFICEIDIY